MNTFKISSKEELAKEKHDLSHIYRKHYIITPGTQYDLNQKNIEVSLSGIDELKDTSILINLLQDCANKNIEFRNVFTNGNVLLKEYEGKKICQYLIKYGAVNIDLDMEQTALTKQELAKLFFFFKMNDGNLRLSYNSSNSEINSFDSIVDCIKENEKYGMDNIIFREKEVAMKTLITTEDKRLSFLRKIEDDHYFVDVFSLVIDDKKYLAKWYKEKE